MERKIYLAPHIHAADVSDSQLHKFLCGMLDDIGYVNYLCRIAAGITRLRPDRVYGEGIMAGDAMPAYSKSKHDLLSWMLSNRGLELEGMEDRNLYQERRALADMLNGGPEEVRHELDRLNELSEQAWIGHIKSTLNDGETAVAVYNYPHNPEKFFNGLEHSILYDGLNDENKNMQELILKRYSNLVSLTESWYN